VLAELDALLDQHTDADVATILNERGMRTGAGIAFSAHRVKWLRAAKGVPSLRQRLRARHLLTANELAGKLGVAYDTVKVWRRQGRLHVYRCNDKGEWLYDPATQDPRASDSESARSPVVAEARGHAAS
jgi:MerR HTH family regulatory protein